MDLPPSATATENPRRPSDRIVRAHAPIARPSSRKDASTSHLGPRPQALAGATALPITVRLAGVRDAGPRPSDPDAIRPVAPLDAAGAQEFGWPPNSLRIAERTRLA